MKKLFSLVFGFAGKIKSELTEGVGIHLRKYHGGMYLGIPKLRKSRHCLFGIGSLCRGYCKRNKHLVGVKSRVMIAEILYFESLYRRKY